MAAGRRQAGGPPSSDCPGRDSRKAERRRESARMEQLPIVHSMPPASIGSTADILSCS